MKPHALVTNDDGIQSAFLHRLVEALLEHFDVSVAAPASEQSWIGRAISRHNPVEAIPCADLFHHNVQAWSISGTPTDCVNIALGNLLPNKPDIVISGINIGFNTTETLILSSGTIAAAIEGAQWGIPAIAYSKCIPSHLFDAIANANGHTSEGEFSNSIYHACQHAAKLALKTVQSPPKPGTVRNVNFPVNTTDSTATEQTFPAKIKLGSLFSETSPGTYKFRFAAGTEDKSQMNSDRAALERGNISHSLLDFSKIGQVQAQSLH
jgi:5'-nucleotidase